MKNGTTSLLNKDCSFIDNEIWKNVEDYDGSYQVSDMGRVASKKLSDKIILKSSLDSDGYKQVVLSKNNIQKTIKVHRLVALAFIDNPDNLPQINHLDGDKSNNKTDNLEWISISDNISHAFRTGLKVSLKGSQIGNSVLIEKDVKNIRNLKGKISNKEIAEQYRVSTATVSNILNLKSWRHI